MGNNYSNNYSAIIKKFNGHFVALCPELNVSAQGESLLEARNQLKDAIEEYQKFSREKGITSASLDIETLREFLLDSDKDSLKFDGQVSFSENFSTLIPSHV